MWRLSLAGFTFESIMDAERGLVRVNPFWFARAVARQDSVDYKLFLG